MRLDLDGLAAASREALMSEWREVVGRPPPKHLSRSLMVQILSHSYQINMVGDIQSVLIASSRAQRGAMLFGLPLNPVAALCESIMGSLMWLRCVMTGVFCGRIRALNPSPTQHAPLLVITSQAFSSLGCAHERPWKACGARSCLYPQKL